MTGLVFLATWVLPTQVVVASNYQNESGLSRLSSKENGGDKTSQTIFSFQHYFSPDVVCE